MWAIIGVFAPLLVNLVYISRLIPGWRKDFSAIAWALGSLAFFVAIFRYRLLELTPVARQTLVDRMEDGMLVLDAQNRLVDINPAGQAILKISPGQAIGKPIVDVWRAWTALDSELQNSFQVTPEITLSHNEEERNFEVRVTSMMDQRERTTGHLVVLHDITRRVQAEKLLQRSNLELQQQNAELDAFSHTVAHDLLNPLGILMGYGYLLTEQAKEQNDSQMLEFSSKIVSTARRIESIINELMLLARLRKEEIQLKELDMPAILANVQENLAEIISSYQAQLYMPPVWPRSLGHDTWVAAIWENLISNAIKYGGHPPKVEIGAEPVTEETNDQPVIRFWVRDNGNGLTEEEQSRLFTEFTRLHQLRARSHGLGLSIVRRVVEKLGGQVNVESVVGQGSIFYFTLPAVVEPA